MSAVTQTDFTGRSSTVNSSPSRTRPSRGRSAGGTTRAVYGPAGMRMGPGSSTLFSSASAAPAPSASARNPSRICRTAASDTSCLARRTRITGGMVYVIAARSAPARRSASSTRAPSSVRLSPAAGAGPSVRSPSAAVAGPSSTAMSPSRITCPVAVTSAGTVMRPGPATEAVVSERRKSAANARLRDNRIRRPQHLVRGLDRLRGHLVGALPGDERHQLLDHAHVGVLEEALEQRAAVLLPRRTHLRRPGGLGLLEQVLAERSQAGRVREPRRLDLAHLRRGGLAGQDGAHHPVAAHRDVLGAARDRDRRLEGDALRRHHARLVVELEGTRAREGGGAVGQRHLEEARPLHGQIERVAGLRVVALHVDALDGRRPRPEPHLDAGRRLRVVRGRRSRRADRLVEQVLEVGPALLEARRVHVGQVVGDDVDVQLLGLHARRSRVECPDHPILPTSLMLRWAISSSRCIACMYCSNPRDTSTSSTMPFMGSTFDASSEPWSTCVALASSGAGTTPCTGAKSALPSGTSPGRSPKPTSFRRPTERPSTFTCPSSPIATSPEPRRRSPLSPCTRSPCSVTR